MNKIKKNKRLISKRGTGKFRQTSTIPLINLGGGSIEETEEASKDIPPPPSTTIIFNYHQHHQNHHQPQQHHHQPCNQRGIQRRA